MESTYYPPGLRDLPWRQFGIPSCGGIQEAFDAQEEVWDVIIDIMHFLDPLAAYQSPEHVLFLAAWVVLTYIADHPQVDYCGTVFIYGNRKRGKGILLRALAHVVYRPSLTETVNEATLFRFAEYYGGTLLLDVTDFWQKVPRRGAEDVILNRFEKGRMVSRVSKPDADPLRDIVYYQVYGPTAIATNEIVPDVMLSRTFPISMPIVPANYPRPVLKDVLLLRQRLLALRARLLVRDLPDPDIIGQGRWQDVCAPITQIAKLAGNDVPERIYAALAEMKALRGSRLVSQSKPGSYERWVNSKSK